MPIKGVKFWIVYINRKNHNAYLIHLYGAFSHFFETNWWPGKNVTSTRCAYELQLQKMRHIDSAESPCDETDRNIDLEGCLQKYIESQINCSIPWGRRQFKKMEPCQTEYEFQQYNDLSTTIKYLGERGIYERTGCKSNCDETRYEMKKRHKVMDYSGTNEVNGQLQ